MNKFIEKLISKMEEISEQIRPVGWSRKIEVVETKAVIEIINKLAEEYNNGWIPCSNRLPEKHGEYIVMIKGAILPTCLMYSPASNEWFSDGEECEYYSVIAWQALPAPYQSKGE